MTSATPAPQVITAKRGARDLKGELGWCARAQCGLLAALIVIAVALYVVGIRPPAQRLAAIEARAAAQQRALQANAERIATIPAVEQEIDHLRQSVERFDQKLPRQRDLAQFIGNITEMGHHASIQKLNWRPEVKPRRTDEFAELPVHFTFEGNFPGVFNFLRQAEDMQRLMRIRKLDVRSTDGAEGQVDVQLTMNIYFTED